MQAQDVLDHLEFVVVQSILILAHVSQGADFRPHVHIVLATTNAAGNQLGQPHKGHQSDHDELQNRRQHGRQSAPVFRPNGLGDNFRQHQNGQGHHRGGRAEPGFAKHHRHLGADPGSPYGMGDRIEGENGGQGFVDIVLVGTERLIELGPCFPQAGDETRRNRQ